MEDINTDNLAQRVSGLLLDARRKVLQTVNHTMVMTYYEIGKMIVEEEQNGKQRAAYGKQLITELSKKLIVNFGKGYSQHNLEQMRQFYLVYSIPQTVSAEFENEGKTSHKFKLSWSHYLKLMRIDNSNERNFYEIEAAKNNGASESLTGSTTPPSLPGFFLAKTRRRFKGWLMKDNHMKGRRMLLKILIYWNL